MGQQNEVVVAKAPAVPGEPLEKRVAPQVSQVLAAEQARGVPGEPLEKRVAPQVSQVLAEEQAEQAVQARGVPAVRVKVQVVQAQEAIETPDDLDPNQEKNILYVTFHASHTYNKVEIQIKEVVL